MITSQGCLILLACRIVRMVWICFYVFFSLWSEKVIDNSGTTSMWLTIGIRVWSPNPKISNIFLQRSIIDSKLGVT